MDDIINNNFVIFFLILSSWALLIVSFSSYWYKEESHFLTSNSQVIKYYRFDQMRTEYWNYSVFESAVIIPMRDILSYGSQLSIYRASLSLVILGWIALTATLVLLFLNIFEYMSDFRFAVPLIRTVILLALGFSSASCLTFIGIGSALEEDCQATNNLEYARCSHDDRGVFLQHYVFDDTRYHFEEDVERAHGPAYAWYTAVASSSCLLVASILSFALPALAIE
ncbi:hypothetical protein DFA_02166 [Cavenderia fasciculata]|uniref:Transmembrane protein n=1 Tax=Cavenderia fasciculata TaxID=261658 RepID=F4PYB2_CACFS|nr:uncharacterized protein DFA_02166 [Cavenderia fasciculata]EGG19379.1 hypothetical protein DFA_02166 [Cavenderia fasciculata]|eukprot:XP_004357650.1 hypothetical protein DFA_02166 [Cavenderia fasciculata]